ncbi:MAG: bifunctional DNA primase/polymerase [Candidatus Bipolaricaulota bacterium]
MIHTTPGGESKHETEWTAVDAGFESETHFSWNHAALRAMGGAAGGSHCDRATSFSPCRGSARATAESEKDGAEVTPEEKPAAPTRNPRAATAASDSTPNAGCLSAALDYLALGWAVIPLNGKRPCLQWEPYQQRHPTEAEVRDWWAWRSDAGVGVVTGAVSSLVVLDEDGPEAKESLKGRHLPITPTCTTAEGVHRYFAHPGFPCRNAVRFLPGLDVRADGGYVVAPPSPHPSGVLYTWADGLSPADVPLAPCPAWLLESVRATKTQPHGDAGGEGGKLDPKTVLNGVREGQRDDTLYRYACRLRAKNMAREEAEVLVLQASAHCKPAFPEEEAFEKVREAWKHAPGTIPTGEELPFAPRSALELREVGLPARADVVAGVLPRGGLLQVLAPPKGLKTWLCLHLAFAAVRGETFLDTWPMPKTRVLYLSGEGGPALLMERLALLAPGAAPELADLFVWTPQPGEPQLVLTSPLTLDSIVGFAQAHGIGLIIVDPLVAFHHLDENSTAEMALLVGSLLDLARRANAGVALAHHTGKGNPQRAGSPAQGRGSTVLWGAVDSSIVLDPYGGGAARLTAQLRWGPPPDPMMVHLDPQTGRFAVTRAPTRRALDPEAVAEVLLEGPADLEQIAVALKSRGLPCSRKPVEAALGRLGERVTRTKGAHGRHIYRLAEEDDLAPF